MGRHSCCTKQKLRKGLWSPEEDEKLFNYITRFGVGCWSSVPKLAGLQRCGKSCRLRWINYLRPDLKRGMFSQQEEDLIVNLHKILGNRWAQIAAQLPGRTDNEIKNLWNSSLKKKLMKQGIDPTTHQPLKDQSSELSQSRKNDAVSSTHSHLLPPPIMAVKSEQPIFLDETTLTNNDQFQHFFIKPTFQVSSSDFEPMLGGPTGFSSLSQNQEYNGFGLEFSDPADIIPRVDSFSTYNTSNEANESSSYSSISSKVNVGEMNSTGQFCNLDGISGNYTKLEGLFDQYDYNDDQYNKKEMNAILSSVVDEFDKDRKPDNPWLMEPLERTGFDELQLSSSYPLKLISEELGSSNFDIFQQLL